MAEGFDAGNPPFDRLAHHEVEALRAALDIGYFAPGETVVAAGRESNHLHVLIKGAIEVRHAGALQAVLGPKDIFDPRAVVHGAAGEDFIAAEETLCHLIPRGVIADLISRNAGFAAFFYAELSRKLDAFSAARRAPGVESVLHARVREAKHGTAIFIGGGETIEAAGHRMREHNINALFVQDGARIGVVTGMNLSKAVVLRRLALDTPIREVTHFDVAAVDEDDFVFEALLMMTRHDKRRLAVRSGGVFTGFLEDIDILGLFAGNSQLVPGRIDRARGVDDLVEAAHDIEAQVERLHGQGIKAETIAEVTSDLNRRLYARLFDLTAPPAIRAEGCLMLMGSEGRGEQTVRTDQDNGLLLAGRVPEAELARFREDFSGALQRAGFPPCPGNVMVRNPVWSQLIDDFLVQLRRWVQARTPDAAMNIAIFWDAVAVAGNPAPLARAKSALVEMMRGEQVVIARFAHLIETFAAPNVGLLGSLMVSVGLSTDEIDIKRSGSFPVVHGVRTLTIDHGITAESTAARIAALVEARHLDAEFGTELLGALRVFMEFRLRAQLEAKRRGTPEREAVVRLGQLSATDRDLLRDGLRIVRQFRDLIGQRYNFRLF
jgi:CBS domain-containing protein